MENSKISLIVAAYNIENYINECLKSIINQTYQNIEIIVVNDGSTDKTLDRCKEIGSLDSRIKIYSKKNGGLSDARNFGLTKITGDYFIFVDGDDILDKNAVKYLYDMVKSTKCKMGVCGFERFFDQWNNISQSLNYHIISVKDYIRQVLSFKINTYAWGVIMHKSLKKTMFFPIGKYFEDMGAMYKVILECNQIAVTDLKLVKYRQNEQSIVHNINQKKINDYIIHAHDMCNEFVNEYPEYKNLCDRFLCYVYISCLEMSLSINNNKIQKIYKDKIKKYIKDVELKDLELKLKLKFQLYKKSINLGLFLKKIKMEIKKWRK